MQETDPFVARIQAGIAIFMRRSMHGFMHFAKESGLSMQQVGTLFSIHKRTIGVSDVGIEMDITSAAASQMLERLVQQGLVTRTEDPRDRRVKQIVLTEKGLQIIHQAFTARQGWLDDLSRNLSEEEKEQIIKAFDIVIEKANQLDYEIPTAR